LRTIWEKKAPLIALLSPAEKAKIPVNRGCIFSGRVIKKNDSGAAVGRGPKRRRRQAGKK